MAVYDVCAFNGETDLLDLRLHILDPVVDWFFVVEFNETFSGKKKKLRFPPDLRRFTKFFKKLTYFAIPESIYSQYYSLADTSPNVPRDGPAHWRREFAQKESLKWTLACLQDNDTVFIGDVDEIVDPRHYREPFQGITKFKLRVYTYWLNNRSSEQFWGPIRASWGDIKDECLNHVRNSAPEKNTQEDQGWHFTSLGGHEKVKQKLLDSYTSESYASDTVISNLESNIHRNRDFLGRDFSYRVEESNWPEYLTKNKSKYAHLCL